MNVAFAQPVAASARAELVSSRVKGPQIKSNAQTFKGSATQMVKVDISYSLPKNRLTLHEPVILNFVVKNGLAQPVDVDLGADRKGNFLFTVKRPDGSTVQLPPLRREGISLTGKLTLTPGQTYAQKVLLNEWYEFPTTGRYELSARLAAPVRTQEGVSVTEPAGFHTTLEVTPRDAERLGKVAASLTEQIISAASYEEAAQAALALSHIKDPAAVPYMEKALASEQMVEPIVIDGLEKVGGAEAIRALTSASTHRKGDTAKLARAALERMRESSQRDHY